MIALLMIYKTQNNPKKALKVLSCVIYTIISNYVCIDYLACEYIFLSELPVHYKLAITSTVTVQVTGRQITSTVMVQLTSRQIMSTVTVQVTVRQNDRRC